MKRDLDLLREILLKIESSEFDKRLYTNDFVSEEFDYETVAYHLELLNDSNFIVCTKLPRMGTFIDMFTVFRLTSTGHDYLDSVRDESIYKETKSKLGNLISSATLNIIQSVANQILLKKLGI